MLTILRVENKDGEGPYFSGKAGLAGASSTWQPTPNNDDELVDALMFNPPINVSPAVAVEIASGCGWSPAPRHVQFGFADEKQLTRWFSKSDLRTLKQGGWLVRKLQVPPEAVAIGGHQCIFNRDFAQEVGTVDIDNFLAA